MGITNIQRYTANYIETHPGTALTEYVVRKILYGGGIPFIKTGNKRLFQENHMNMYLEGKRWPADEIEACERS